MRCNVKNCLENEGGYCMASSYVEIDRDGKCSLICTPDGTLGTDDIICCKDCVSWGIDTNTGKPLSYNCYTSGPDDFCSRAIRKRSDT